MVHCVWTTQSSSGKTGPDDPGQSAYDSLNADPDALETLALTGGCQNAVPEVRQTQVQVPGLLPLSCPEANPLACLSLSFSNVN